MSLLGEHFRELAGEARDCSLTDARRQTCLHLKLPTLPDIQHAIDYRRRRKADIAPMDGHPVTRRIGMKFKAAALHDSKSKCDCPGPASWPRFPQIIIDIMM